jgi:hypothetical protein
MAGVNSRGRDLGAAPALGDAAARVGDRRDDPTAASAPPATPSATGSAIALAANRVGFARRYSGGPDIPPPRHARIERARRRGLHLIQPRRR